MAVASPLPQTSIAELANFTAKQQAALDAMYEHLFVLYGGAGGGGKSHWLRWAPVDFLIECFTAGLRDVRFGLFCENYPTLSDRQITKMATEMPAWLGRVRETRENGLGFYLHEAYGGGIICLRNLDDPSKYSSAEFAGIAVEELTKNDKKTFDDLRWRRRWPGLPRCPFIAATNPPGIGHAFVKKLWIDRDFSDDDARLDPDEFAFIQALPTDNPHLSQEYWNELNSLPEAMRQALLFGNWDLYEGQVFQEWRRDRHVCKPFEIPAEWPRWIGVDWGWDAPFCVLWAALAPRGWKTPEGAYLLRSRIYIYREVYARKVLAQDQALMVAARSRNERILLAAADGAMWAKETDYFNGQRAAESIADEWNAAWKGANFPLSLSMAVKDRHEGVQRMHRALAWEPEDQPPFFGQPELVIFDTCTNLIRELPSLPTHPIDPELWDEKASDHAADCLKYLLHAADGLVGSQRMVPAEPYRMTPRRQGPRVFGRR